VEKDTRNGLILFLSALLLFGSTVGVVSYFIGRSNSGANGGAGRQLEEARRVNTELAGEQQRTIELNQRAISTIERIGAITEETSGSLRELGDVNRRSSDLSTAIREEATLLANYFRSISSVLDNYVVGDVD